MKVLKAQEMNRCIGCLSCMITCAALNQHDHSIRKSAIRVKTSGGLSGRFIAVVCQGCRGDISCVEVCPCGALTERKGGGVLLDAEKCVGCELCVDACIIGAVFFDQAASKPIICKHCGVCVRFCPHKCLHLVKEDTADDV